MVFSEAILHNCLYFTANSLSRIITRMAEDEFRHTGISPSYAYVLIVAYDHPGISQKEICNLLNLAPSTVTRFVDTLVQKKYLIRKSDGKISRIYTTGKGKDLQRVIRDCWHNLYSRYAGIIGREEGDNLAHMMDRISNQLQESES